MKTNIRILVWSFFGCLFLLSACEKEKKTDYVLVGPVIIPPPQPERTHRVAEDINYRLGKWARIFEPTQTFYRDTLHFRTDSTLSWSIPLGINRYKIDKLRFDYEWTDFVSPSRELRTYSTGFDTLNEVLTVFVGGSPLRYKKVR